MLLDPFPTSLLRILCFCAKTVTTWDMEGERTESDTALLKQSALYLNKKQM